MDLKLQKTLENCLEKANHAAEKAANILLSYYNKKESLSIESKQVSFDLITKADKESEKVIISIIEENFPEHSILAEESGQKTAHDNEFLWIIDPIDGTTNFAHGYPVFCISIALFHKGQATLALVKDPTRNETFTAIKGMGAFLNSKPIHVSETKTIKESLLVTGFPYSKFDDQRNNYERFSKLTHMCRGVRRTGSAALDLCYVAAGKFDAYWEETIKIWDIAAGILLLSEAGGHFSHYSGSEYDPENGQILASNGLLHKEMIEALKL